ncbi:MAG: vWA domain-containing protein [Pseudobdellovibrio sp.]
MFSINKHQIAKVSAKLLFASALAVTYTGCEKGAGSFSVLTNASQYVQSDAYVARKVDVLFVVDNSGSMSTSQSNLANNFDSFIQRLISRGFDFRIGVTTSDTYYQAQAPSGSSCIKSGVDLCLPSYARLRSGTTPATHVIDSNDYDFNFPSEVQRLKDTFKANALVGIIGSGDERAFSSFKATLQSNLNTDFRRSDAYLAIVLLSDEDDFSLDSLTSNGDSYSGLHTVQSYKDFLDTYTGGVAGSDYSVSTISILDEACRTSLFSASGQQKIGQRYIQLADLTGGTKNSLCGSFSSALDNISNNIVIQAKPVFKLSKKPIISSIVVVVNGVKVPQSDVDGWSYDAVKNTITINGSTYAPVAKQTVSIYFDPDVSK